MSSRLILLKLFHTMHLKRKTGSRYLLGSEHLQDSINSKVSNVKIKVESNEGLCRVCLKDGEVFIYGSQSSEDVSEYLSMFAGIDLEVDDVFPKYLCKSCSDLLNGAIVLRKTAQRSEQILKNHSKKKYSLKSIKKEETITNSKTMHPDSTEETSMTDHEYDSNFSTEHNYNSNLDIVKKYSQIKDCKYKEEEYYCSRCKIGFETEEEYTKHKMSDEHENVKIKCDFCNKFYAPLYYKKHIAIHTGDVPYMCDICGKKFIIKGQCTRHRLTHFYSLPFQCSLCPYKGRFRESLKMHMRTHTGEKPYQCTECNVRFNNKSNLNKHMFTHKGDYSFRCESCGRGFYTKRNLDHHIEADHRGIKEHICDFCGKAFGYRKHMMKHQLKVHKREKVKRGRMPLYLQAESQQEKGEVM